MKVVHGDLLDLALQGQFDVIVHGANCQCTMNSGIARQIRERFPEAFYADQRTGVNASKLGSISAAGVLRSPFVFWVVNAYTQVSYGRTGVHVDYEAVRSAMQMVAGQFDGGRIGYPRIGAGLGGGDWNVISAIIDEELEGQDHTLVEYLES